MASCVPAGHCESSMGACTSSEPAAMTASAAATRMRRVVTGVVDVDDGNLVSCLTPTIARKSGLSGCVADWMAMLVLKRRAALSSEGSVLKVRSDFGKANRLVKNSATFRCNAHDRRHGLVGIVDATSGGSTPLAAPHAGSHALAFALLRQCGLCHLHQREQQGRSDPEARYLSRLQPTECVDGGCASVVD